MALYLVQRYKAPDLAIQVDSGARTILPGTNVTFTTDPVTGAITINGAPGGSGTVTSVGLAAPTGFTVSGSPVTTSGTLTFSYTAGYVGYTTAEQTKLAGIAPGATANTGTVTSVNHTGSTGLTIGGTNPITSSGTTTFTLSANLQAWSAITTASKYDSSNPSGYITSAALAPYVLKAGDTMSGALTTPALNTAQINPILTQGFQFVWNSLSAGSGRTEFLNNRGFGVGGFEWWDRANTGVGPDPVLMTLDSTAGNLAMRGAVTPGFAVAGAKKLSVITIGTAAPGALADGTLYLRY